MNDFLSYINNVNRKGYMIMNFKKLSKIWNRKPWEKVKHSTLARAKNYLDAKTRY